MTPFSISSGDLWDRLGKTSEFPDESGSAAAPRVDAVLLESYWSGTILAFLSSPLLLSPISMCYIYCSLVSFKKGGERDGLEEYFWSFCILLLSFNHFVASTVYTFLPIMYKTQRWKYMTYAIKASSH